jgi:hypothetical protein
MWFLLGLALGALWRDLWWLSDDSGDEDEDD